MTKDLKTPEELAEEWADRIERQAILCVSLLAMNDGEYFAAKKAYKAGYKAAQQWTSIYNALPETDEDLLWGNPHSGIVIVAPYNHKFSGELGEQYFTHWMVVPEMPKGEA